MCNTLTPFSDVTSINTMSSRSLDVTDTVAAQTVNTQYADVNVSMSANRLYTAGDIFCRAMINSFDGFRLTSINGATNYFYTQMDANGDVSSNLISNTNNINFIIGGNNVGYFTPADGFYVKGGIIFDDTGCIGYDELHNLIIINNYNEGVLLPDIDFSINDTIIASFSCNNPIGTDNILDMHL